VDQSTSSFRFGFLRFGQRRAHAGQRKGTTVGNQDDTGYYMSDIDKALLSSYPSQTTGEAFDTGDASTKTFAHTLANRTGVRTVMYVSVTDGTETFVDDRNGNMTGNLAGTGTVNYATGAVSVTFNSAPANSQAITCSYYYEDATSDGPLDFDTSSLGAGKAKIFRQDDGGTFMAVLPFLDVEYAFHLLKTWAVTTTIDDTAATMRRSTNDFINDGTNDAFKESMRLLSDMYEARSRIAVDNYRLANSNAFSRWIAENPKKWNGIKLLIGGGAATGIGTSLME
jgi:hypothetical protein